MVVTYASLQERGAAVSGETESKMIMNYKSIYLNIILLMLFEATGLRAQNVEVTVTGIRSEKGQIAVGVFLDNESFRTEKAFLEPRFSKKNMSDGTITFSLSLEPGEYGMAVLDDENSDGKMEYGRLGMPKEGFGFSNYYHTAFSRPKFTSFRFSVEKDQVSKVTIRMRYF
jgi:uncharacterized protein (DUF2141 family)